MPDVPTDTTEDRTGHALRNAIVAALLDHRARYNLWFIGATIRYDEAIALIDGVFRREASR